MSKAEELLAKMNEEILAKVDAIVLEQDENIKKYAESAYQNAVNQAIADIKASVEEKYAVAKAYLTEIIESENVEEIKEEASSDVVEDTVNETVEEIATQDEAQEPVVL